MNKTNKFLPEVRERALGMVQERRGEYPSLRAAIESIASKIGCVSQNLLEWVKRQVDGGLRAGINTVEAQLLKGLEREVKELRRQRDLEAGQRVFRTGGARPPTEVMKGFIDTHRTAHGVEPICKVLQITPSGYRRHAARQRDPQRRCARAQRDDVLVPQIEQVWQANMKVYGAYKVWRQLAWQGTAVARCTVRRLMRRQGLHGVRRGTTVSDSKAVYPQDKVNRQFRAERPDQL